MGAANRREAARTRGVSSISTVVSSLPNLGAGVRNYVHHVRFVPKQDSDFSARACLGSLASPEARLAETRRRLADRSRVRVVARFFASTDRSPALPTSRQFVVRSDGSRPGPCLFRIANARRLVACKMRFRLRVRRRTARRLTSPSALLFSFRPPSARVRSRR